MATLFVLEEEPPTDHARWYCHLDGAGAPGFDTPEEAVAWGRQRADGVVVRALGPRFYLAGQRPVDWGEEIDFEPWPPPAEERAAIDLRYKAACLELEAAEASWRVYEGEREAWLGLHAVDLAGRGPCHECSIVVPDGDEEGIHFEELAPDGTVCGAWRPGRPGGFGAASIAIGAAIERSADDPWVAAVAAALERERTWEGEGRRARLEVARGQGQAFHVTAAENRLSIQRHGLDWRRMGGCGGVAGRRAPELPAVFLCRTRDESAFFVRMARWPCDVWAADVDGYWLETGPSGWLIVAHPIPPDRVRLAGAAYRREP